MAGFVADQIASDAVITAKILDGNITTAKLAADAVDGTKLADNAVDSEHLTALSVETAKLDNLSVTTGKIAADAIDGTKVADLAIDTEHLAASAVETAKINNLAVTTAKIAADAVDGTKIADNAIGNEHLQNLAVDTAELAAGAATLAKIDIDADLPMGTNKITGLGDGTTGTQDACTVTQMETHVSTALVGNEWLESVKDRLSAPPGGESTGDRYLIIATASGVWLNKENQIAEYNGSGWTYTDPGATVGLFVSVDDETGVLYYYGGSSWSTKTFEATTASLGLEVSGLDVRIAASAAGNGITLTTGVLSVDANTETGATVCAVNVSANGVGTAVDGSTIEHNSNTLRVKADGIGINELGGLTSAGYMYISNGTTEAIAALTKVQETTQNGTGNWAASAATVTIAAATGFYGPIQVYYNGQYWEEGASGDYTISGNVITLNTSVSYGLPFEVIGMAY